MQTLRLSSATCEWAPIPWGERDLPCVTAEPFFKVDDAALPLEGPAFERDGSLLFVDIQGGRVLRLSPAGKLSTVYAQPGLNPSGIAVHRDGRIFVAAVGPRNAQGLFDAGTVFALAPDGSDRQVIVPPSAGHAVNDLVFDRHGGIYLTDFRGASTQPIGGVYYRPPEGGPLKPAIPNLCGANGIALGPDDAVLWATEFSACRLHRADLTAPATMGHTGTSIPYHFVGPGPDSMRADVQGHVYVALNRQGRVLVFSPYGIPVAQILLPGREQNHFLRCTSLALLPGSRELFIVARDEVGGGGAMVFRAGGLADGLALFSHQ
jgi:lactonase